MIWYICLLASLAIFLCAVCGSLALLQLPKRKNKKRSILRAGNVFAAGLSLSAVLLFIPLYYPLIEDSSAFIHWLEVILLSIHNTVRLFIVDGEFTFVLEKTAALAEGLRSSYNLVASVLFFLAPFLTFGFVLSFVASLSARWRYLMGYFNDAYIFSELNQKSLALARDLKKNDPSRVIVFTDIFERNDESSYEIIENAKMLGAILFKNDITVVNFKFHSKKSKLYFFIIGENEAENINQTLLLATPPKSVHNRFNGYDIDRKDTRLYLFSNKSVSEQQLSSVNTQHLKIRRVNDVQSLVYNLLYEDGNILFEKAVPAKSPEEEKTISALIVGMGLHGSEMVKGLSWFCQMAGYRLQITALDKDKHAESKFRAICPELMDAKHNNDFTTPGEAHYSINIHGSVDVSHFKFNELLANIGDVSYVMVALGNDDLNIQTAIKIRTLLGRDGKYPFIHAIVYNSEKQSLLQHDFTNYANISYNLTMIGDLATNYSEKCILQSKLEELALDRHMAYTKTWTANLPEEERRAELDKAEREFWKYDYNYRSSTASVIHRKYKSICGIPGIDKPKEERTEDEKLLIRTLEHQRWNAYVRSEGFVLPKAGMKRDKLAMTHDMLVPYDDLSEAEKAKDDD
ncbi:MAG: hypothetical protein IKV00_06520 [Clostridia bacterium]|nr:hypothetical protein [Clostridia bacterium]